MSSAGTPAASCRWSGVSASPSADRGAGCGYVLSGAREGVTATHGSEDKATLVPPSSAPAVNAREASPESVIAYLGDRDVTGDRI